MDIQSHERLLIIDFGSQVTQLIARRLRELNVYCEIHPYQKVTDAFLAEFAPKAVILSGGPDSVTREGSPRAAPAVFTLGVPVLGICYGQQTMMQQLGGQVDRGHGTAEFGRAFVTPQNELQLLNGWFEGEKEQVWMSHGDHVSAIAPGFEVYGTSPNAPFAITADVSRNFYAVQFHPEVHHTPNGAKLYENFVKLAGFTGDWTMGAYREQAIAAIRAQVGDKKVICGLSGGVDSSVAAVLIHEAIGDQLTCVFVNNGLLRQNEAEEVLKMFRENYNIPLIYADEQDLFMGELEGQSDPETKRKIIGSFFIDVFQKHEPGSLLLEQAQREVLEEQLEAQRLQAALAGTDEAAVRTLDQFIAWLARVAGDAAMTMQAKGGVYLAGGIAPSIVDRLKSGPFRSIFEEKGRLAFVMRPIPVYVIVDKFPAFKGCAAAIADMR